MRVTSSMMTFATLADRILGGYQNPQQILTEPSLLSRLEAGQIDASSGYLSATRSHHLPFIALPDEINLSNPEMEAKWYKNVQFSIALAGGKTVTLNTQPLVFYATVLKDSKQPALAEKFVQFLQSPEGHLTDIDHRSPGFDLGQIKDVVNQGQEIIARSVNGPGKFHLLFGEVLIFVFGKFIRKD